MKISYNWLKWYVPEIPSPAELADVFTYKLCEVESIEEKDGDHVFDLKILPDRAHDLYSHRGVGLELSGLLGISFQDPTSTYKIPESLATGLSIKLESDNCRRYMARAIRNIKVGPSPDWVVKHLESIGQRSINNIVDATNLVMYNCGQPCHAFDLEKLKDNTIFIRNANEGESITTLDNKEVSLKPSDMLISDSQGSLAIAGVKGGKKAEVDSNTKDIVLEIANFDPVSVRKTARRIGILTDSAKRFENDLTPEIASYAMCELSALIMEMCPDAKFEDVVDVYPSPIEKREVKFSSSHIEKILGVKITKDTIRGILENYKYDFKNEGDGFSIIVPELRLDITGSHDMAEEIGRVYGYEKIVPEVPKINFSPKINSEFYALSLLRKFFMERGFSEIYDYAFCEKGELEVLSPLSKDKAFLRTNLKDGLENSLSRNSRNADLLGLDQIRVFELGHVFKDSGEEIYLAFGIKNVKKSKIKENEILSDILSELSVVLDQDVSPISNSENVFEINLSEIIKNISQNSSYQDLLNFEEKKSSANFISWSSYPFIVRDISGWVDVNIDIVDILSCIKEVSGDLLVGEPRLIDRFEKDERVSYAFRLVFQAFDRTLTDEDANSRVKAVADVLVSRFGFEIR